MKNSHSKSSNPEKASKPPKPKGPLRAPEEFGLREIFSDADSFVTNQDVIAVKNARVHNLKNLSVNIPRDSLTVITGLSGSGKSSLAFDTIYAEGQRRYVESLSSYARQFITQVEKPDVESITGLSPTISIQQKSTSHNPRSTVGTVTEIWDFLRVMYARLAVPYCYQCGDKIQSQTSEQIIHSLRTKPEGTKLTIMAPLVRARKGEHQKELLGLRQKGFVRARVNGEMIDLSLDIALDKNKKHTIDVVIDRMILKSQQDSALNRLTESVELALKMGQGSLLIEESSPALNNGAPLETLYSQDYTCRSCSISYPPPEPRVFSFNSPLGACEECEGLGTDPSYESTDLFAESEKEEDDIQSLREEIPPCPACHGARLNKKSLSYKFKNYSIHELATQSFKDLQNTLKTIQLSEREQILADRLVKDLVERLDFLNSLGVDYLSLSRPATTLSGGEAQRIRLASQLGSSLIGVIYVLDEPSIGLHQRDNHKLIKTLETLRDRGNTVLVVEHDLDTMNAADYILDIGPKAGVHGGELIAHGTLKDIKKSKTSLTAQYLSGAVEIKTPKVRRPVDPSKVLKIKNAHENNLKNVDLTIPLGVFTAVTGVSGSGKSSLIMDTLLPYLHSTTYAGKEPKHLKVDAIEGFAQIDKVVSITQTPIGRTPRSNPATYTGVFTFIRDLFAQLPDSKLRGFKPGRFSFNVEGGRCPYCEGGGLKKLEMHFMGSVYLTCESCKGKRYNRETCEVLYKGKSIADVLDMTIEEALDFFDSVYFLKSRLQVLKDVGLDYLRLGQSATTLSGGEAQRIKLAKELSKKSTSKTVYILDEPTTGLHFDDVRKLVDILQLLVNKGNSVIVIEHNLDLIKCADHVIDIGPEAGRGGGRVVAQGTPEEVARSNESVTAPFLGDVLPLVRAHAGRT